MLDEPATVSGIPCGLAQSIFERRERAGPACEIDDRRPENDRDVNECPPPVCEKSESAENRRGDERKMRDQNEVRCKTLSPPDSRHSRNY